MRTEGRFSHRDHLPGSAATATDCRLCHRGVWNAGAENLDQDVGDLKASLLLEFFVKEIGPSVYNQAIADAQADLQEKVADLDATRYEPEFTYWDDRR